MKFRKVISLLIALIFAVLLITGVLSYFNPYTRLVATLHTTFGILFTAGVAFHLKNNIRSLISYSKGKTSLFAFLGVLIIAVPAYFQAEPFRSLMDHGAKSKAASSQEVNIRAHEIIEMNMEEDVRISIDLLKGEHYWHPQMAVWMEDDQGNYLETLFVSNATAKGLFYGGRSKDNFKEFDVTRDASGDYRRVNALPVWSHKRNVRYADGMYVPSHKDSFPEAISGATISESFKMFTSIPYNQNFRLRIEINVAFDDNEYYSEFDFPEDEVYHSGTGQMGQPSIVFDTRIDLLDGKKYYLMELIGHGHQSGQTGVLYEDLTTLTTAREIVERIVVGVHSRI